MERPVAGPGDAADAPDAGGGSVPLAGAEAVLEGATYLGRPVLRKRRLPKTYRHPTLDARLRDERTRDEANLLLAAARAGVRVPVLYDAHRREATLSLEFIDGPLLRDALPRDDEATACARMEALGRMVARLHDAGLTHGDLTTSNVLVEDASDPAALVLIDFGLGQSTREDEPRGVDLHLVEEALEATDDRAAALTAAFLRGYGVAGCAAGSLRRLEQIRLRGRYREAV